MVSSAPLPLSWLLRQRVLDRRGRAAPLLDLVVTLRAGDYPQVTDLILPGRWSAVAGRTARQVPWTAVDVGAWQRQRHLLVEDLDGPAEANDAVTATAVRLKRDVLDRMVIDVLHGQTTRANDLWLEDEGDSLALRGVDTGGWAILRRVSRGLVGRGRYGDVVDWHQVEFLRGKPGADRAAHPYHRVITRLAAAQIAHLADALPYPYAAELLLLLPEDVATDTLEAMSSERQVQVFEELPAWAANPLLARMAPDLAADLLAGLPPERAQQALERLPDARRRQVLALLRYPEDTAGGIMTNEIVVAPGDLVAGKARHALRNQLERPDFVYYVFVVDDLRSCCLRGVVTLRDLYLAPDLRRLSEIMRASLVTLHPLESTRTAAYRVVDTHLLALPVVDDAGALLGAVTVDAAIAQVAPHAWRQQAPRMFS